MTLSNLSRATFLFLLAVSANSALAANLYKNGRFEEVKAGLPKYGAAKTTSGKAKFEIALKGSHNRKNSLLISSTTGAQAAWGQEITVKRGTIYRLRGYIKTENLKGKGQGAAICIRGVNSLSRVIKGSSRDGRWDYVECKFIAKTDKVTIDCLFGVNGKVTGKAKGATAPKDPNISALEHDLAEATGLKVGVSTKASGAGTLTIQFDSPDQLDDVIHRLKGDV